MHLGKVFMTFNEECNFNPVSNYQCVKTKWNVRFAIPLAELDGLMKTLLSTMEENNLFMPFGYLHTLW